MPLLHSPLTGRSPLTALRRCATVAAAVVLAWSLAAVTASAATPLPAGDPTVAALFGTPTATNHHCTASVVASAARDVVLTAAHCVSGTGAGIVLAPGYHDGTSPYGRWSVTAAYVDPRWTASGDQQADWAFLTVAPLGGRQIQDVVGGNTLVRAPASGRSVTVTGYVTGSGDEPITCTRRVTVTAPDHPTFTCGGYRGGTSGSPFLVTASGQRQVSGVIGGLHQGGCTPSVSYSSPFTAATMATFDRAVAGGAGDLVPPKGDGGCSTGG